MNGIDISNNQEGLTLSNMDFDFCIVKATDGTRFVDWTFKNFLSVALQKTQLVGFYHFANNPERGGSAKEQAKYFVDACKDYFGVGIPILDWEDSEWKYGGPVLELGPSFALEFLREVYRLTGVKPLIYTSKDVCNYYDWSQVQAEGYKLYGAQYAYDDYYYQGYQESPWQSTQPWGAWGFDTFIFQYGAGYLNGANMPVDLDKFDGTVDDWLNVAKPREQGQTDISFGCTANDIIRTAKNFLGANESDGSFKRIIDIYNTIKPLPVGYELQYTDDWCDAFVSACAWLDDAHELIGAECGVERHIEIFKEKGIWIEDGSIVPRVGDIIVYNWDKSNQPNDGFADHIGFVVNVEGDYINTIEGNVSQSVAYRRYPVGSGYIRGFARPKYAEGTNTSTDTQKPLKTTQEVAEEVINGVWGNNEERKRRLEAAGYDYDAVQGYVNYLLGVQPKKLDDVIAQEVLQGFWGNGSERKERLESAGYDYLKIQSIVNRMVNENVIDIVARRVINGDYGNGKARIAALREGGYDPDAVQKKVNELLANGY